MHEGGKRAGRVGAYSFLHWRRGSAPVSVHHAPDGFVRVMCGWVVGVVVVVVCVRVCVCGGGGGGGKNQTG